jgi:hypothetical protein
MVKTLQIDDDLHREFKVAAALRGVTMADATEEAIRDLLAKWQAEGTLREKEENV